jgi:hypothetical protein
MTSNVESSLPFAISMRYTVRFRDWRKAATPTFAVFGRIASDFFSMLDVLQFGGVCSRPVTVNETLPFVWAAATPTPTFAFNHACFSFLKQAYNGIYGDVKYKEDS